MTTETLVVIDARGHHCPVPTLKLRKAVEQAAPGRTLQLLADDPMARIDVPHFAAQNGLTLVEQSEDGPTLSFVVVKPL